MNWPIDFMPELKFAVGCKNPVALRLVSILNGISQTKTNRKAKWRCKFNKYVIQKHGLPAVVKTQHGVARFHQSFGNKRVGRILYVILGHTTAQVLPGVPNAIPGLMLESLMKCGYCLCSHSLLLRFRLDICSLGQFLSGPWAEVETPRVIKLVINCH